jgi:hypothetical protein
LVTHVWLWQSEPPAQFLPLMQGGHVPPPQSTSVSDPFLTPSEQVGWTQTPPAQAPVQHWPGSEHDPPAGTHDGWQDPVTQVPLQHWLPVAHVSPFGSQAATQTPAEQFPVQQVADNVHD